MQLIGILGVLLLLFPLTAHAYVGPGLGLGAFGAILGVLFSIFLALFAIFWYPFKRFIKKLRSGNQGTDASE